MIEIQKVSKQFGKLQALQDINLKLNKGKCIALIGPNGCGKTTLIKCILGMVLPNEGDISFDGINIKEDIHYRQRIGYMPQIGRYPDNMTIGQIINMIKDLRRQNTLDESIYDAYKMATLQNKRMRTLSGGTTQKVSATLAFLFNPDVLILDEPTAGLDPLAAEILKNKIIEERAKGKLILVTSHLLNELDDFVTDIIFMQEGKIIIQNTIDELLASTGESKISKAIAQILKSQIES